MSHGACWRFWVWCATLSRGAHRPLTTRTAGSDASRGFSSTSRSLRGEERSFSSTTKRRRRWNAAAPAAWRGTVSPNAHICESVVLWHVSLSFISNSTSCIYHPFSLQFPVIWPFFTMTPLKRTLTASTCTVPHWRAAFSATEATLFSTTSQRVSRRVKGKKKKKKASECPKSHAICGCIEWVSLYYILKNTC